MPSSIEGFNKIVSTYIGNIDLVKLAEERAQGTAISSQLAEWFLDLDAFLRLVQVRMLATAGIVKEEEWAEVYSILVQRQKRVQFADWLQEEKDKHVILGPDQFQLPDAPPPSLPLWRASLRTRRSWEDILDARIKQEQTLVLALQASVDATEAATLPLLRDALIAPFAAQHSITVDEAANRLTKRLLVDFKMSGKQKTTRLAQTLETLQGVLFSLRSGRMQDSPELPNPAAHWTLTEQDGFSEQKFDLEWRWMGAYETWRAVFSVLLYPEQYLLPSLYPEQVLPPSLLEGRTQAFTGFIGALRTFPVLTPQRARGLANDEGSGAEFPGYKTKLLEELNDPEAAGIRASAFRITEELTVEEIAAGATKLSSCFRRWKAG